MKKSLSDLNGTDPYIHNYHPLGVLQELPNVLIRTKHRPTVVELEAILTDLKKAAARIKRGLPTKSLFGSRAFEDLVLAAQRIARTHVASLRQIS